MICALSDLMRKQVSGISNASTGRWGGEEFMILLPGIKEQEALEIAEDIRKAFAVISFPQAGYRSVSLGVTQRREHEDEDSLVLRVDQALYEAKKEGKNRSVLL